MYVRVCHLYRVVLLDYPVIVIVHASLVVHEVPSGSDAHPRTYMGFAWRVSKTRVEQLVPISCFLQLWVKIAELTFPIISDGNDTLVRSDGGEIYSFPLPSRIARLVWDPCIQDFMWEARILHPTAFTFPSQLTVGNHFVDIHQPNLLQTVLSGDSMLQL